MVCVRRTYPIPQKRVWLFVHLYFLKLRRIRHLPVTFWMRNEMSFIFSECLVKCGIEFCLWEVKHERLLTRVSANRASVECIRSVICSSIPIQECSGRHFHLPLCEYPAKYLNSKTPRNWNGPFPFLVVANGLLNEGCWVKLHWNSKPLKGFYSGSIREDWLNHIKVVQWHQWSHWMSCKKPEQVPIHIVLFQQNKVCQCKSLLQLIVQKSTWNFISGMLVHQINNFFCNVTVINHT